MDNIVKILTWPEIMVGATAGCMRQVESLYHGRRPRAGMREQDGWSFNIEGACAEIAVAKYLGWYYPPVVGNPSASDVGLLEVRANLSRQHTDLLLRPNDHEDRIYVSVLSFLPRFVICGWIVCKDGIKVARQYDGNGREPCWFVPREALHPMAELPAHVLPARREAA